ncbi:MAG TPA: DUF3857 and transglutaminase domain-containing protein, partial [Dissulfurispiraceae bacterium]
VKINKDYSYTETTHTIDRIQQEGAKDLGEITLEYDQKREEITDIEAYTIMPDGTKLRPEKIQDLNAPSGGGIYSDDRVKVITMPNVTVGSTIDWKATKVTKTPVIPHNFYDSFRFTCTCPIKEARYRITAPKGMKLNFKNLNNAITPKVETSGEEATYTWETYHNETDDNEEFMPSPEERIKRITVSTLTDWKQFSAWAWSLYQKNLTGSPELKKKVRELTADKRTTGDKIQAIIDYIRKDYRYVFMGIESHSYEPHPEDEIFKSKYGDCKDQTLLAIAMLSEIGVKAWPTLLSTGSDLKRRDLLPIPFYFNHVILSFDLQGREYFTDVLLQGYKFQEIPVHLANKGAFVVDDRGGAFVTIPPTDKAEVTTSSEEKVTIRDNGSARVELTLAFPKSVSIELRERLKSMGAEEKEKFYAAMETRLALGGKVLNRRMKNEDVPYSQLLFTMSYENPTLVQRVGDMMMFGLPQVQRGTLFSSPKRRYPVVFLSQAWIEGNVAYTIPDGYEVVSLPKKISLDNGFASYTREYIAEGSRITGKEFFVYKQARIPVEDYHTVQGFFDELSRTTSDKVVIRKQANTAK